MKLDQHSRRVALVLAAGVLVIAAYAMANRGAAPSTKAAPAAAKASR